jgi:hypothetical protein
VLRPLFTRVRARCFLRSSPVRGSPRFPLKDASLSGMNAHLREKACGSNSSVLMPAAPLGSPHEPAALRLPGVPRRGNPRPHDLAVLGGPSPCARQWVVLIVDHGLQAVDLRLGERQRVHERVGYGVLIP